MRSAALGATWGLLYAVLLRAWMRLVSTEPQFTWGGTGYILGVFTVLGTFAGLATAVRHRPRWSRVVRTAGLVLGLGCFVAAGSAMLPAVAPAAFGRARTDWPRPVRVTLVAVGAAAAVWLSVAVSLADLAPGRLAVALVLYLALTAVEVELFARLLAPGPSTGPEPLCERLRNQDL